MKGETEEEENQDLVMVSAAKSTASLCLSIDRTKGSVGKKPSVCHKLELAAVGMCGKAETSAPENVFAGPGPKKSALW